LLKNHANLPGEACGMKTGLEIRQMDGILKQPHIPYLFFSIF